MKYIRSKLRKFKTLATTYIHNDVSALNLLFIFIDYLTAYIIYGAYISDYFEFGFYFKRHKEKKNYITYRKHMKIRNLCNQADKVELFNNKAYFNNNFKQFIHRDWIAPAATDYSDFLAFIKKHPVFFVKPIDGRYGSGVYRKHVTGDADYKSLYSQFADENAILEAPIIQDHELSEFNPSSVNTLRIYTLKPSVRESAVIMAATIRIGNGPAVIDNFSSQGLGALIDVSSGIICSRGFDQNNNFYTLHPASGKQITGFKIPRWEEIQKTVITAADIVPEIQYVGWDIAIGSEHLHLIEGNAGATLFIPQAVGIGLWPNFKQLLKQKGIL